MTDAPTDTKELLNHDDKGWTDQAIANKSSDKKKTWIIIIALILILGTAGLIIGLVVSNNNDDSVDDDDDVDVPAWKKETFSYDAEL